MTQDDHTDSARSAPLGLRLFPIYLILYCAYMGLTVFAPTWMAATVGGINVAILYGFALIVTALVLALVYAWLCRQPHSGSQRNPNRDQVGDRQGGQP